MATFLDVLKTHLLGPDLATQLEQSLATLIQRIGVTIGRAMQYVMQLPPSSGYEPLLIKSGWNPILARVMAKLAVRHGKRCATESKWRRPVFDAIRFLAQRQRQTRAIFCRATLLLEARKQTSIIETIFDKAGFSESEFIRLLELAVKRREVDRQRIREIAAMVSPHLSLPRGPKVSAPSAAHEFLLRPDIRIITKRRPDTHHIRTAEYVDALTEATRREFGVPDFDSRPARRRLKARQRTCPASK